jgi:ribosomal peptide maturation radical SAM protein 1
MAMNVLLISMPFASAQFASMGLSSLRPVLEREGIACDILYQNLSFRNFVDDTEDYDDITERCLLGEWVFGRELFGETWANSQRGSIEEVSTIMKSRSGLRNPDKLLKVIMKYRQAAGAFIEKCMTEVEWERYDIVGFTSVFDQQIASLALAGRIKKSYPKKVIAFGGANCQGEMGLAIMEHFPFVDWVISGDGDESFPRTIKRWFRGETLDGIEGLVYRKNSKVIGQGTSKVMDLDKLPYPNFADYFQAIEKLAPDLKGKVPLSLELSRGCWWSAKSQCTFCGIHSQLGVYRHKNPERALNEINDLVSLYGVDNVWVIDSNLPLDYSKTVLPALGARDKKLNGFFVETKATTKYKTLQALKQAGTNAFQPGIESLDTEILQYMSKGTTMLQNVRILKWARECGLHSVWNFLHSFPGENAEAYHRMAAIIPYLVHLQPPLNVGPIALQRFSPLYNHPEQWNMTNIRASKSYEFVYPFPINELNHLAYTFDFDALEDSSPRNYINDAIREIILWKDLWSKNEPPMLAYEWTLQGSMVVYDTRPVRKGYCIDLEKSLAIALHSCDSEATLDEIRQRVRNEMGETNYPGERFLREGMKLLETYGFILREEEHYLSLVYPLQEFRLNNESFLAYLL